MQYSFTVTENFRLGNKKERDDDSWESFCQETYSQIVMKSLPRGHPQHVLFHKPYGVLSKFTDAEGRPTLADFLEVPHVYPAGRLDMDSEGLMVLTSDETLAARLTSPSFKIPKTYWVQVERIPNEAALEQLRRGVLVKGRRTRPATVHLLAEEPRVYTRSVPIRVRKTVPTAWLSMEISEGMNRQIRRMTAQVGHPTLRVIRISIGSIHLDGLAPGEWRIPKPSEIRRCVGSNKNLGIL